MRVNGIRVSAIAALALAGCASGPPPEKPSDVSVKCMAYLGLEAKAAPGDAEQLNRASANWRTIALVTMSAKQVDEYYANSIAVYGAQPADQVKAQAATCLKRAPKNRPVKPQRKI